MGSGHNKHVTVATLYVTVKPSRNGHNDHRYGHKLSDKHVTVATPCVTVTNQAATVTTTSNTVINSVINTFRSQRRGLRPIEKPSPLAFRKRGWFDSFIYPINLPILFREMAWRLTGLGIRCSVYVHRQMLSVPCDKHELIRFSAYVPYR